jgi:hypothetical protein
MNIIYSLIKPNHSPNRKTRLEQSGLERNAAAAAAAAAKHLDTRVITTLPHPKLNNSRAANTRAALK